MSDYIKREDAIFIALQQPFFQNSMATEIRQIKGIDIVRCKECKFREANKSIYRGAWYCSNHGDTVDLDDYCSFGERSK